MTPDWGCDDNFAADPSAALRVVGARGPLPAARPTQPQVPRPRGLWHLAADTGTGPFLDLGTGLPTRGNVHQPAPQTGPAARVVHASNTPIVIARSRAIKTGPAAAVIHADPRDPAAIPGHGLC